MLIMIAVAFILGMLYTNSIAIKRHRELIALNLKKYDWADLYYLTYGEKIKTYKTKNNE